MVEELANSGHLSDRVAQNLGKRNERINATQFAAENLGQPKRQEPVKKEEKISAANGEQKKEPTLENPTGGQDSRYEDKHGASNDSDVSNYKPVKRDDDDKIFGMNKYMFYGGVALILAVGGYFAYRHYAGKKAIGASGSGAKPISPASAGTTAATGGAIKK